MKTELKQIIEELEEVIKDKYKLTDFEKIDIAVRILNSQSINKNKFNNYKDKSENEFNKFVNNQFKRQSEFKNNSYTSKEEPPTQKQIDACKRKGITIPAGSSKKEVWKIMNNKERE
jgi:hypothetical protein